MAFRNILGVFPTYIRPPYVHCDEKCHDLLESLGYHSIFNDLDTFDYENNNASLIQTSKDYFSNFVAADPENGNIQSHDIQFQTVYNLTKFMLDTIASSGYGTSVTVGNCLLDPPENWYREAGAPVKCPPPTPLIMSTGGNCTGGITCQGSEFGNCCSKYGSCGSTPAYCDPAGGCQSKFGTCGLYVYLQDSWYLVEKTLTLRWLS